MPVTFSRNVANGPILAGPAIHCERQAPRPFLPFDPRKGPNAFPAAKQKLDFRKSPKGDMHRLRAKPPRKRALPSTMLEIR
jgi:hypothetical protein